MTRRKKTINLKDPEYQPSKAELEQTVKLDVPGRTTEEKMDKLAKAVVQPVNVLHRSSPSLRAADLILLNLTFPLRLKRLQESTERNALSF